MAYEVFERSAVRVGTPVLAIAPGGRIAFNAAACRLLIEAGVRTVVILWDKDQNKMAIRTAPKGERNSFTITFTGGNHSASLRASSFLSHVGWNAPKRVQLATTWNTKEKMFEAILPTGSIEVISAGRKRPGR